MVDHATFLAQKRFGSLDGLRALGIVAVVWHHTQPQWARESRFGLLGIEGVTLFFAISGFLITTLLLRERSRSGRVDLKAFYARRTLRIFPLYYAVLVAYVIVVLVFERDTAAGREFMGNLPYFVTYTSNYFVEIKDRVIFYFAWSLSAEEQFYLLWPPLLACAVIAGRAAWVLLLVLAASVATQSIVGPVLLNRLPVALVAGALMAVTLHSPAGFQAAARVLRFRAMPILLLMTLALMLTSRSTPAFFPHVLFAVLVGSCVISERHALSRLLAFRPVAYVGMISYGMYLFHMLCKNAVVLLLSAIGLHPYGIGVFLLTLAAVIGVAAISFRYYESFFNDFRTAYVR